MTPKLLIITQIIDTEDSHLGFFHLWLEKFATKFPSIVAICLKSGKFNLPKNVKVLSLGKEGGSSRIKYISRFYKYIWFERRNYDAVFVHMNQEYVLLGWWLWKILGKKIYMWRNHHSGFFLTDLAGKFCNKVFCTSKFSYTANYKNTMLMPVGVDLDRFKPITYNLKPKNSLLFLGRIAPTKNIHIFIEALGLLQAKEIKFSADIVGDVLPKDVDYLEKLKSRVRELGLGNIVNFCPGVPHDKTPELYNSHEIFVNLSSSGMYDKTIFEAMACGCLVLASNENLRGNVPDRMILSERSAGFVADKLDSIMTLSDGDRNVLILAAKKFTESNSLDTLGDKLATIIQK